MEQPIANVLYQSISSTLDHATENLYGLDVI